MPKLVQIISAKKRFKTPEGDSVTALDDVSLEVNTKEFITLLGPWMWKNYTFKIYKWV